MASSYAAAKMHQPPPVASKPVSVLAYAKPAIISPSSGSNDKQALSNQFAKATAPSVPRGFSDSSLLSNGQRLVEDELVIEKQNAANQMRQAAVLAAAAVVSQQQQQQQHQKRLSASERLAMGRPRPLAASALESSESTSDQLKSLVAGLEQNQKQSKLQQINQPPPPPPHLNKQAAIQQREAPLQAKQPAPPLPPPVSAQQLRGPAKTGQHQQQMQLPTLETLLAVQRQLQKHTRQNLSGAQVDLAQEMVNTNNNPHQVINGPARQQQVFETYDKELPPLPESLSPSDCASSSAATTDESQMNSLESQSSPATSLVSLPPPPPPPISCSYLQHYDEVVASRQSNNSTPQSQATATSGSSNCCSSSSSEICSIKQFPILPIKQQQQQQQQPPSLPPSPLTKQHPPVSSLQQQHKSFHQKSVSFAPSATTVQQSQVKTPVNPTRDNHHQSTIAGMTGQQMQVNSSQTMPSPPPPPPPPPEVAQRPPLVAPRPQQLQQVVPSKPVPDLSEGQQGGQQFLSQLASHQSLSSNPTQKGAPELPAQHCTGDAIKLGQRFSLDDNQQVAQQINYHHYPRHLFAPSEQQQQLIAAVPGSNSSHNAQVFHPSPPTPSPPPPPPPLSTSNATTFLADQHQPAAALIKQSLDGRADFADSRRPFEQASLSAHQTAPAAVASLMANGQAGYQSDGVASAGGFDEPDYGNIRFPSPPPPELFAFGGHEAAEKQGKVASFAEGDKSAAKAFERRAERQEKQNEEEEDDEFQCRLPPLSVSFVQRQQQFDANHQHNNGPTQVPFSQFSSSSFSATSIPATFVAQNHHHHLNNSTPPQPPPLFRQPPSTVDAPAQRPQQQQQQQTNNLTVHIDESPVRACGGLLSTAGVRMAAKSSDEDSSTLGGGGAGAASSSAPANSLMAANQRRIMLSMSGANHHHHHHHSSSSPSSSSDGDNHSSNSSSSTSGVHSSIDSPISINSKTPTTSTKPNSLGPANKLGFQSKQATGVEEDEDEFDNYKQQLKQQFAVATGHHLKQQQQAAARRLLSSSGSISSSCSSSSVLTSIRQQASARTTPPLSNQQQQQQRGRINSTSSLQSQQSQLSQLSNSTINNKGFVTNASATAAANQQQQHLKPPRPALKQKKSVSFSDKIELVACAEEEREAHLPNPLLARVLAGKMQ